MIGRNKIFLVAVICYALITLLLLISVAVEELPSRSCSCNGAMSLSTEAGTPKVVETVKTRRHNKTLGDVFREEIERQSPNTTSAAAASASSRALPAWRRFEARISDAELYEMKDPVVDELLHDLRTQPITAVDLGIATRRRVSCSGRSLFEASSKDVTICPDIDKHLSAVDRRVKMVLTIMDECVRVKGNSTLLLLADDL